MQSANSLLDNGKNAEIDKLLGQENKINCMYQSWDKEELEEQESGVEKSVADFIATYKSCN